MLFFSNHSLPAGIAYAIPHLPHLSTNVFIHTFCSAPFPKRKFNALLPHCSLPARNSEITPRLPFISAEKIKCPFLIAATPAFLRKEMANEGLFRDSGIVVFFSKYFQAAGIAKNIPRLPYISAEKISGVSLRHAVPAFLRKEMANE
jgi:hypothetical protein